MVNTGYTICYQVPPREEYARRRVDCLWAKIVNLRHGGNGGKHYHLNSMERSRYIASSLGAVKRWYKEFPVLEEERK